MEKESFSPAIPPVPPDIVMMEHQVQKDQVEGIGNKVRSPGRVSNHRSFREAVASSSQWFSEAKKIVDSSME